MYIIRYGKNEIRFPKKKEFISYINGKRNYTKLMKEGKINVHGGVLKLRKVI